MTFDQAKDPQAIIVNGDVNRLIQVAQEAGKTLAQQRLTTSQIRNIFGEVRAIEANWQSDPDGSFRKFVLLEPKLAYGAARSGRKDNPVGALAEILTPCIQAIRSSQPQQRKEHFSRFVDFFEAILAYHKAAGGN
jgi:CRISPR-associated protein Csm2